MADSKFDYGDDQLGYWAHRIKERYPKLQNETFIKIIQAGTEGKWKEKYEPNVCLSMIISWIEKFKQERDAAIAAEEESIQNEARSVNFETGISLETCLYEIRRKRKEAKEGEKNG